MRPWPLRRSAARSRESSPRPASASARASGTAGEHGSPAPWGAPISPPRRPRASPPPRRPPGHDAVAVGRDRRARAARAARDAWSSPGVRQGGLSPRSLAASRERVPGSAGALRGCCERGERRRRRADRGRRRGARARCGVDARRRAVPSRCPLRVSRTRGVAPRRGRGRDADRERHARQFAPPQPPESLAACARRGPRGLRMRLRVVRRTALQPGTPLGTNLHPVLGRVYAARGVRSLTELDTSLARLLPVGTLEGTPAAVELLLAHRAAGRVLIIGDFDADGATSSALMVRALTGFGFAAVDFLVPNRFEFGYGLTPEIVALAATRAPTLIVTVDNGISSNAGVVAARSRGIDVLITDHHLPGAELPDANVIVNPNLEGSRFGSRALAGVGVAFYVVAALARRLEELGLASAATAAAAQLLDLVALGTVADVVPLDANNRVLVAQGLKRIRAGRCTAGIRALLAVADRAGPELSAADLGFAVAPRLNAAGRLDDMSIGIRCLLADDAGGAGELAARLDELNQERRAIEARMQQEALGAVRALSDPQPGAPQRSGVCLFDASWHQGVVGLVAGRVAERLRRPVIAFAVADESTLRGSARSVAGIHIRDVLALVAARHPDLIHRFGGHP